MTIIKSEFLLAINQVATERGISPQNVMESIKQAVIAAFKKDYPQDYSSDLEVNIGNTGEIKIFKNKKDITPPGFGRIAAQTAKQVVLQSIREAEKRTLVSQFKSQVGSLIKGRIIRFDKNNIYLDIGKTEALLPKEEQIFNEKYQLNNTLFVYLKEIVNDKYNNPRIIVSRTDPNLIKELFKKEVPEIANNAVEIKKVVREPGERAKIAVTNLQPGVDPVGACVGQKGIRVQTVTEELGGKEKIDIIQWNEDIKQFITAALSPAKIDQIKIDKKRKIAEIVVGEDQAPLAIGKNGINVNLASKLTAFEINITQKKNKKEENG